MIWKLERWKSMCFPGFQISYMHDGSINKKRNELCGKWNKYTIMHTKLKVIIEHLIGAMHLAADICSIYTTSRMCKCMCVYIFLCLILIILLDRSSLRWTYNVCWIIFCGIHDSSCIFFVVSLNIIWVQLEVGWGADHISFFLCSNCIERTSSSKQQKHNT